MMEANQNAKKANICVYQIGFGTFGKNGFEKLLHMSRNIKNIQMEVCGIADISEEARKKARLLAEKYGIEIKIYAHTLDMYKDAIEKKKSGSRVLIYDAGPSNFHESHIMKSILNGFFHITEKPPAMTESEYDEEKKLSRKYKIEWFCDFIEEENEAVLTAIDYIKKSKLKIRSIDIFRESSVGVSQILSGSRGYRSAVAGGDILDKCSHEIYLFKLIESTGQKIKNLDVKESGSDFLMIGDIGKKSFVNIYGEKRDFISLNDPMTASGQSHINLSILLKGNKKIPVNIRTSWLGISEQGKRITENLKKHINAEFVEKKEEEIEGHRFYFENLRLFVIKCDKRTEIYGDMKNKRIFVRKSGKYLELKMLKKEKDALYRMLESSVLATAGKKKFEISHEDVDMIMKIVFSGLRVAIKKKIKCNSEKEFEKTRNYVIAKILKF